jgi:hypothetical protein
MTSKNEKTESDCGNGKQGLAAWPDELSKQTAPLMDDGRTSKELVDELNDHETELPK